MEPDELAFYEMDKTWYALCSYALLIDDFDLFNDLKSKRYEFWDSDKELCERASKAVRKEKGLSE